jgi:hypothetical protein
MLYSKPSFRLLFLAGLFFAGAASGDQPKHQIHSEADLPRTSYPVTGSISTLLQSDDSVFAATVKKAATDLDALLANYDIQDKATLISILTAKLSLQELGGDAAGGLETIRKLFERRSSGESAARHLGLWL